MTTNTLTIIEAAAIKIEDGKKIVPKNFENTAAKLKAQGTNSRKVGAQKTLAALHWVYRWGWSYPYLVDHIASSGRRGLAKRLVDQKLLSSFLLESAGGVKGIPLSTLCLTKDGQAIVESSLRRNQLLSQGLKDDIPYHQLRHDAIVQRATALHDGLSGFETPKEIASKSAPGIKQPDVIWVLRSGRRMGIELEMTHKKSGREINQTIGALLEAVKEGNHHKLNLICILSPSQAILEDYTERLSDGAAVSVWGRDTSSRWMEIPAKKFYVPKFAADKFLLERIEI
jgi:hypothetical protein